jgi:YD repeat-containing protein
MCADPLEGGRARLVGVVDRAGNAIAVSYDRPSGLLLGLEDDLGHRLEARGEPGDQLIRRLEYDGTVVATYEYSRSTWCSASWTVLDRVRNAESSAMREYAYDASKRLQAVKNESGDPVAEFSYDTEGRATGVVDARSNVAISYGERDESGRTTVSVTEYYADTSSTSERVLTRRGDVESVSEGCSCGRAQTLTRSWGRVVCSTDSMGHVTYSERDEQGRVIRQARYDAQSYACPPPVAALPAGYEETWFGYELTRPVAQGVIVSLDRMTSVAWQSALGGPNLAGGLDPVQ